MITTEPSFTAQPTPSISDSLLIALFFAAVIHAVLILGIRFSMPTPEKINKSISVTLANYPSKKAPEKAEYLAQENQQGAGKQRQKPKPLAQKISGQGQTQKKQFRQNKAIKSTSNQRVLTRQESDMLINSGDTSGQTVNKKPAQLNRDSLARQIAQLGSEVRDYELSADHSRIKFVNAVSTHKYLAANYEREWQAKVQKTGNLNYPEVARQKQFTGKLVMAVGINFDGSIYSIRIPRSSGYPSLDDAAKRIVRMSAPFAPLPKSLRKELDVLIITRVWQFSDETGMSAQ